MLKILHSADQDLEIFEDVFETRPLPFFDTQEAATLCGEGEGIGYQKMLQQLFNIDHDKTEQKGDWLKRPLHHDQLNYAAFDVFYLPRIYDLFTQRLTEKNRLEWIAPIQDKIYMPRNQLLDIQKAWLRLPAPKMSVASRLALILLAAWREATAQETNKHRKWILKDHELIYVSQKISAKKLNGTDFLKEHAYLKEEIESICDEVRALTAKEQKEALQTLLKKHAYIKPTGELQKRIEAVRKEMQYITQREHVPLNYFASKREIEAWAERH